MRIIKNAATDSKEIKDDVCKYANGIKAIKSAIEELSKFAETDEIAKDALANLSVVLLDLDSCNK